MTSLSTRLDWQTPPHIFEALDREFHFAVDAAANRRNALLPMWYGPGSLYDDAFLVENWFSPVFVNPPYGRYVGDWAKLAASQARGGCTVVALLPAYTEVGWWYKYVVQRASQVRFIVGRLSFGLPSEKTTSARFASAVVVWEPRSVALDVRWVRF